ncbi:MAG: DUF4371 domain-containing protein [Sedimenticola sp.]
MQIQTWQKAGSMWSLATVVLVKIQLLIFLTDVCPDLGTLTSSRRRLTDELKFTILTYQAERLPTYPLNHDTNHARRYNPLWEDTYSWLRYSPSTDGVFCGPCFVFGPAQTSNAEFFTTPFSDWKNAIGKKRGTLVAHNASNVHCDSIIQCAQFLSVCKGDAVSIKAKISAAYAHRTQEKRSVILSIIDVIIRLASRGIPFRGRWDKIDKKEDSNFIYFVDWLASYDATLKRHLDTCPLNAKYTSPQIQNDIITCIGDYIRAKIVGDINKSPFFSIMADETTDAGVCEQLSICVRYLVNSEVREDFLGFVELPRTNAETITHVMIDKLREWKVDLDKWRGKGFDGAATMSGHVSGVQARITELLPHAKFFTHCQSHCLNLAIVASCTKVPQIRNFMNTFKELTLFFGYSAKRKDILKTRMKNATHDLLADSQGNEDEDTSILMNAARRQSLPTLSDTRWLARVDSISTLLAHYDHIYDALQQVADESQSQSSRDASSFMHSMQQFENIVVGVLTQYVLGFIRPISISLQAKQTNLLKAHTESRNLIGVLKSLRSDNCSFDTLYERAVRIATSIEVVPSRPRKVGRQSHRANAGNCSTTIEHYKINHFYPFLDHIIRHLDERFPKQLRSVLNGTLLLPGHHDALTADIEHSIKDEVMCDLPIPTQYEQEIIRWKAAHHETSLPMTLSQGLIECDPIYFPNVASIFQLIICLPVGSCTCERSFSSLRILKTWSRTSMLEDRLNGLALMYVHRGNVNIDPLAILKLWDASGHRRIALAFDKPTDQ